MDDARDFVWVARPGVTARGKAPQRLGRALKFICAGPLLGFLLGGKFPAIQACPLFADAPQGLAAAGLVHLLPPRRIHGEPLAGADAPGAIGHLLRGELAQQVARPGKE